MPTCPTCRVHYPANGGGHCRGGEYGGCCRTFTSDSSFAAHRTGPPSHRTCLDVTTAEKWRETPHGWTHWPQMPASRRGPRPESDETGSRVGQGTPEVPDASESDPAA